MSKNTEQRGTCDPQAAAELLRALAHPMRLQILCRLLDGELAVAGFETELGLKQPSLSQQLASLREAGLVATRREAKSVFYRLADDRVRILLAALHEAARKKPHPAGSRRTVTQTPHTEQRRATPPAGPARSGIHSPAECGEFPTVGAEATQAWRP